MSSATSAGSTGAVNRLDRAGASARLGHAAVVGAVGGMIASLVMAGYAMIASVTYQHHGFFTPLFHIASVFLAPTDLMMSVQNAASGDKFYFVAGPALLGAVIHMMTGAMYGAVFAVMIAAARLRGPVVVAAGAAWGVAVFAASTWVGLPLAANVFSSGDQITNMATMVGYPTFIAEHVLFGLALGLLVVAGGRSAMRRTIRH